MSDQEIMDLYADAQAEIRQLNEENRRLKSKIEDTSAEALTNYYQTVELKAKVSELENDVAHEVQRSQFYKGEFLRRKGNKVALEEFDEFKAKLQADAILNIMDDIGYTCETATGDDAYSADSIYEYAEKVRRGES